MPAGLLPLCLTVFFGRICDVTFGSIRTILLVDGKKLKAAIAGFIESFIWFLIVNQALSSDIESIWIAITYALGFALGNYVGGLVSEKILGEMQSVRIITEEDKLATALRNGGFAVTEIACTGMDNKAKKLLFIQIANKKRAELQKIVNLIDPKAFITISKTKQMVNGYLSK